MTGKSYLHAKITPKTRHSTFLVAKIVFPPTPSIALPLFLSLTQFHAYSREEGHFLPKASINFFERILERILKQGHLAIGPQNEPIQI
jgi:hypothetical protein